MTRAKVYRFWTLASVLMLALVASAMSPAHAGSGRGPHGVHSDRYQRQPAYSLHHGRRPDVHHRHYHIYHRHHSHHRHYHGPRHFFGLYFSGYPYAYPYAPYPYEAYSPGEHRLFPAFRLPGFFHYPGAIGKGEVEIPLGQNPAVPLTPQRSIQ